MRLLRRAFLIFISATSVCGAALAQSEQEFINAFSGQWYVFDANMRDESEACGLVLSPEPDANGLQATTTGCAAALKTIVRWSIDEGRIILSDPTNVVAILGGNQFRVTGQFANSDTSIVIERAQGDGSNTRIAAALRKHRCYFIGFTQQCAQASDLQMPVVDPENGFATVEILANLNARGQPRRDAPLLGNIAQGTSVRLNQCLTASDGPWCRARVGDSDVWLAMTALRQDEWPILTYRSSDTSP